MSEYSQGYNDEPVPPEGLDDEALAQWWADKLGIHHEGALPLENQFDENLTWEQRKRQQLGDKGFEKLKLHNQGEHNRGLANVQQSIQQAIADGRNEYARQNLHYPVVAVAILGSWAEGQTHRDSDLDIFILVSEYDPNIQDDFIKRLKKRGVRMKIECEGVNTLTPGQSAESTLDSSLGLFAPYRIVVHA